MRFLKRVDYRHYICVGITLLFVLCSIFVFPSAFGRVIEAFRDLGLSIGYYFTGLTGDSPINVTVNDLPKNPFFENVDMPAFPLPTFPEDWATFKRLFVEFWHLFATKENIKSYVVSFFTALGGTAKVLIYIVPVFASVLVLIRFSLSKENNDFGRDTKPLKVYKKITKYTILPTKKWLVDFFDFVKGNKPYLIVWGIIWAYNLNLFTILIEFFAYYFYFAVSFDVGSIYRQVYKLIVDIWVPLRFISWPCWLIVGAVVFDKLRKKIGYTRLNHNEMKNRGFINERPIVYMVCGTMGKKKTTAITDMALSQEVMFRDKAYELILQNDLKFPNFPWINFERMLKVAMDRHVVYNLATCRKFVRHCRALFDKVQGWDKATCKAYRRHLKKTTGLNYHHNFLFGYDFERFGYTYNDKLKIVDIWEVLENYAQLYFIYIMQSSLLIANYSVRVDNVLSDAGNFPVWNTDFFQRDSRYVDAISRHAHILDFDSVRLGKKVLENNKNSNNFEFGVVLITEVGKERGNTIELSEKKKNDKTTNQKNDLFNSWLKMVRHSATVDNFPFVRVITDEQRPESWGADARDLCDIIYIKDSGEVKLTMPWFSITEMFYSLIFSRFEKLYLDYRYKRGDNSLAMYVLKNITARLNKYYIGIYNRFGYSRLKIQVTDGTMEGSVTEKNYYLSSMKAYSKRFATDCYSDTFTALALRSSSGINDLVEYETERATFDELKLQNSYFVAELVLGVKDKE